MSKQKEKLTFNGFTGYYGPVPNGYGGFDWRDIDYINNNLAAQTNDEGFQDAIRGRGEAGFANNAGGYFVSANLSETFSLKSMLAASGAGTGDPVIFSSYVYKDGKMTLKAIDVVEITPQVQKIDFATLGGKGDFQNISAVAMAVGSARYASHYGHNAVGEGMIFDNMAVTWNGKIPDGKLTSSHGAVFPPHIAHTLAANSHLGAVDANGSSPDVTGNQYHSALTSLDAALGPTVSHGGLTGEFALPKPDHFGT
jgi:hypothetical protein